MNINTNFDLITIFLENEGPRNCVILISDGNKKISYNILKFISDIINSENEKNFEKNFEKKNKKNIFEKLGQKFTEGFIKDFLLKKLFDLENEKNILLRIDTINIILEIIESIIDISSKYIIYFGQDFEFQKYLINKIVEEKKEFNIISLYCSEILSILFESEKNINLILENKNKNDLNSISQKKNKNDLNSISQNNNFSENNKEKNLINKLWQFIDKKILKEKFYSEEEEKIQNILNILNLTFHSKTGITIFLTNFGVKICLDLIKAKNLFSLKGLRLLMNICERNVNSCNRVVSNKGLGIIFPLFYYDILKLNFENKKILKECLITILIFLLKNLHNKFLKRIEKKMKNVDFLDFLINNYKFYQKEIFLSKEKFLKFKNLFNEENFEEELFIFQINEGLLIFYYINALIFYQIKKMEIDLVEELEENKIYINDIKDNLVAYTKMIGTNDIQIFIKNLLN